MRYIILCLLAIFLISAIHTIRIPIVQDIGIRVIQTDSTQIMEIQPRKLTRYLYGQDNSIQIDSIIFIDTTSYYGHDTVSVWSHYDGNRDCY